MRERLHLILTTDARIEQLIEYGMAGLYRSQIRGYASAFDVDVYSADGMDYSGVLGARHHPLGPRGAAGAGRRVATFYAGLLRHARSMRGIVRVVTANVAVLPEVRRISRSPTIVDFRYDWAPTSRRHYGGLKGLLAGSIQKRCASCADLIVATTPELRSIAERRYGRRAIVIPNFVDSDVFHPQDSREETILYAGRLHWAKGIDVLIRAFARVAAARPACRLVLFGNGDQLDALREKVPLEIASRVEFRGSRPQAEVGQALGRARIGVLPTLTTEGHPKALIEAMACGTPLVCTSVPGIRGLVTDGRTGFLVPPGNPEALADAMLHLLEDRVLWSRFSAAILESSRRFQRERIIERQIRVMRILAARGRWAAVGGGE